MWVMFITSNFFLFVTLGSGQGTHVAAVETGPTAVVRFWYCFY